MTAPRHEFYETDNQLTISVFDRNADPAQVSVRFTPHSVLYKHGDKSLAFEPLKGEIDASASSYTVGKVKVEIKLAKITLGRWATIEATGSNAPIIPLASPDPATSSSKPKPHKNWENITTTILSGEKEKTLAEDPNAGGDVNNFFQQIFSGADENTKKAMMKSYTESGGTALSTNWEEVSKAPVEVKPPQGQEYKKWAV